MIKLIIFFIPFFLGVWGFLLEGEPLLDAFFYSINLYLLNYTYHPANLCIELARWLAPLMTCNRNFKRPTRSLYPISHRKKHRRLRLG